MECFVVNIVNEPVCEKWSPKGLLHVVVRIFLRVRAIIMKFGAVVVFLDIPSAFARCPRYFSRYYLISRYLYM